MTWSIHASVGGSALHHTRSVEDLADLLSNHPDGDLDIEILDDEDGRRLPMRVPRDAIYEEDLEFLASSILEAAFEADCPHKPGMSISDAYTQGDCDVFAVALLEAAGTGSLHAVLDPYDDRGRKAKTPYLIHAGLRVYGDRPNDCGEVILDITGRTQESSWNSTWSENGQCFEPRVETVDQSELEAFQATPIARSEIDLAAPYAQLVLTLCLWTRDEQRLAA